MQVIIFIFFQARPGLPILYNHAGICDKMSYVQIASRGLNNTINWA